MVVRKFVTSDFRNVGFSFFFFRKIRKGGVSAEVFSYFTRTGLSKLVNSTGFNDVDGLIHDSPISNNKIRIVCFLCDNM